MLLWRVGLVFLLFSVQRVLFFLINRSYFPDVTAGRLPELMVSGLKFDLTAVLYVNSLYLLLLLLPLRAKYTPRYKSMLKGIFLVTNSIALISNFTDTVYFRYILRRSDFGIFTEFSHETQIGRIVLVAMWQYWYLILLFAVLLFLLIRLYGDHKTSDPPLPNVIYYPVSLVVLALCAGLTVAGMRGGFTGTTRPITISNAIDKVKKPVEAAIVLNTPFSIIRTINSRTFEPLSFFGKDEVERIYSPLHQGAPAGSFRRMNVVVLILESFTKEVVGSLNPELENGHYKGYTPFLDSLIAHGYTWKYSFANGTKSIDAIPSVVAGIPSLVQPFVLSRYSLNEMEGLAATLKKKGYDAGFFHGAPNGSMGFDAITHMLSFGRYYGMNEYGNKNDFDGFWGIPDELFLNYCAKTFGQMKEPFLATVFTLSSHHPYILPKPYEGVFKGGPNPLYKCIEYSDNALRKFFKEASRQSWYANTLFVLTADHSLPSSDHKEYITPTGLFSIPIIFYHPNSDLVGMDPGLMQQIDIFPTVMGYLHYDAPYFAFGTNRLEPNRNPFVVNYENGYYQFMEGDYLLQSDGRQLLNSFHFREDPRYGHNLVSSGDSLQGKHFDRFRAFLQEYNNRMIENRLTIK
ncbi:MAG: LTA synthase family protein [Marinilabiliales bacterium]|nr:LTA synthase family protein [Marinilabiliales bacterium]